MLGVSHAAHTSLLPARPHQRRAALRRGLWVGGWAVHHMVRLLLECFYLFTAAGAGIDQPACQGPCIAQHAEIACMGMRHCTSRQASVSLLRSKQTL